MKVASGAVLGCAAVNEHISKQIPETLWHYTTFTGFQGIFNSKKIWATEYRFLNDQEEFNHAKLLAQELVAEEPEFTGVCFPARETIRSAVDIAFNTGPLHEERLRIMVASFSEKGDQLSQWRGYAGDSTGVSIGLDLRGLRPPAEIGTTVTFAPCVYKEKDKRTLLKAVFAQSRNGLQEWWDSVVDAALTQPLGSAESGLTFGQKVVAEHSKEFREVHERCHTVLLFDLMRIAPLLKNESFDEEKEWRLVLPSESIHYPTKQPIEFRPIRDALVPYIAYPLLMPNQDGEILCKSLILGPGSHASAEVGANMFFRSKFIPLSAQRSKIPYRPA
jgi:hypothetical protein